MSTAQMTQTGTETEEMKSFAAVNSALDCALARDERVLLLGEDIADPIGSVWKTSKGLSTKYGTERVRATPIAETSIIGAAIGAALGGYRPVAEIMFFDFIAQCMDQIVNHAAKLRYMSGGVTGVPMTIRTVVGSSRFGAQHAQSLEAWFMHTPGIKVVMPSTPLEAKGLLTACIFDDDPCLFIEHVGLMFGQKEDVPVGDVTLPIGQAATKRAGDDVTVVTYGAQTPVALAAAARLADDGISAEVIDLRTLVPLDIDTVLESVGRTRRAIVTHEATKFCGPGAEIAAQISEHLFGDLLAPVARLGLGYSPIPYGKNFDLFPGEDDIVGTARRLVDA